MLFPLKDARFGLRHREAEEDEVSRLVSERSEPVHLFARVRVPQGQVKQLTLYNDPAKSTQPHAQNK